MDFKVWRKEGACEWSQYSGRSMPCEISDTTYKVGTSGVFAGTTVHDTFTVNRISGEAVWSQIFREANGALRGSPGTLRCKPVTPGTQQF